MRENIGDQLKILELYNMDIYNDAGQYLGEVRDAIVDLEQGGVSRLLMEEWKNAGKEEVKKTLQFKSVLFKNIKNIGDVVLVSSTGQAQKAQESAASAEISDLANR
jgi:sporulation protein YlmC with PRC-barrel domain